jgi:UDP-2,3-diacylglucosamine hydrolase
MDTLFISDLHLDHAEPAVVAQFREFLATEAREANALYILGDLFELWIGDDDPAPLAREVTAALRTLSDAGVAIHVMQGNRDFLLGEAFCTAAGARLLEDPLLLTLHGQRVLVTHGDALVTDDVPYQKFRALVRDPAWRRAFLALSLDQRRALAAEARAGSREHVARQSMEIMDVNADAVAAAMDAAGVDLLLHGHTHRPAIHRLESGAQVRTRIVLGDWHAAGSVLRWNADGFDLATLPR